VEVLHVAADARLVVAGDPHADHEAIISAELWQKCQEVREINKRNKGLTRRKGDVDSRPVGHALSGGIAKCARCGGSMHHQPGKRADRHWYRCYHSYKGKTCEHKTWHLVPEVEGLVRMALAYVAAPDEADPASVKRLKATMPKTVDPKQVLRDKLKKLDDREQNVSRQHELGTINEKQLKERSWAINEERVKARTEAQNAPKINVAARQQELVSIIAEWDEAAKAGNELVGVRRNQLIREVLEQVAIDHDEAIGTMLPGRDYSRWCSWPSSRWSPPRWRSLAAGPPTSTGWPFRRSRGSEAQTKDRPPFRAAGAR